MKDVQYFLKMFTLANTTNDEIARSFRFVKRSGAPASFIYSFNKLYFLLTHISILYSICRM